jgi:UDP-glucose 4-epimerase
VPLGQLNRPVRILITGGRGYLGGRIAAALASAGHQILIGSRRTRSPPPWLSQGSTVVLNYMDQHSLENALQSVDVVVHAAGMNAQECAASPADALTSNGVFTTRLVGAAHVARVKRFIYLSTAHVYSSPLAGSITEFTSTKNPHPYATSHISGEHAVLYADALGAFEGVVLRLSNAYGAPMDVEANCWDLVVNDLCKQIVTKNSLVLKTTGTQERDFISISQICSVIAALVSPSKEGRTRGIFNLGSGSSRTILDMALLIRRRANLLNYSNKNSKLQTISTKAESGSPFNPLNLNYRSVRLEKIDVEPAADLNSEIDELLKYCRIAFASKQCVR